MRPVCIWTPAFDHKVGGIRALHRLRDDLVARGVDAYMHVDRPRSAGDIVVYPEIVPDNPLGAERFVRWLLNRAQFPNDVCYVWEPRLDPDLPVLTVDIVDRDLFAHRAGPRSGTVVWVHKGIESPLLIPPGSVRMTSSWPADRGGVAELLGSAELLVSFDAYSTVNTEAILLGTPVRLHCTGRWSIEEVRGWYPYGVALQDDEMDWARSSVGMAHRWYADWCARMSASVDRFVEDCSRRWP